MKNKVLCIDDDLTMQILVESSLRELDVIAAHNLKDAKRILDEVEFSALLIDINLPDGDGLRFLTEISQKTEISKIPVLIFSDNSDVSNKVLAFTYGAEDFISKPFDPIELNARVMAKIKRRQNQAEKTQERKYADLLIDLDRQKAFQVVRGKEKDLELTGIELKILTLLTKRLEQVYSRNQIMDQVWGETFITDRTVDSHVAHLRQKISSTGLQIETAKSFGYRAVLKKNGA